METIRNWILKKVMPKWKMLVDIEEYNTPEILRQHNHILLDKEWYIHMQLIKKDTIWDSVIYTDFNSARKWITFMKNDIKNDKKEYLEFNL